MALQAAAELGLSLEGSYMVGDKMADILFGLNIGAVPVLVLTGYGPESLGKIERGAARPAHIARNLAVAVDWIVRREERASRPRASSPGEKGAS
jgi:D-glycero-D-manno-heptose 1,7-bisphosphate phosphatase